MLAGDSCQQFYTSLRELFKKERDRPGNSAHGPRVIVKISSAIWGYPTLPCRPPAVGVKVRVVWRQKEAQIAELAARLEALELR